MMRLSLFSFALSVLIAISAPAAAGQLEGVFSSDGPKALAAAVKKIQDEKGAAEAVKQLTTLLKSKDVELCAAAAHVLGQMGDDSKRALPELVAAIDSDDALDLTQSLNALGPGDIPLWLAEVALDPNDDSHAYRALHLIGLNDPRIVPILIKGLSHPNLDVQWDAVTLLEEMGLKAAPAREALERMLLQEPTREKREDEFFSPNDVRAHAACALGAIGAEPERTVRLLTSMLKHSDPEIRIWSAIGLGCLGVKAKDAIPALVDCLSDDKMAQTDKWHEFTPPRHAAATALINIGPASIPTLIKATEYKNARVRYYATNVLCHLVDNKPEINVAIEPLFQLLNDPDPTVRSNAMVVLKSINRRSIRLAKELLRLTGDKNLYARLSAVHALNEMKPVKGLPVEPILRLFDDTDPEIRQLVPFILASHASDEFVKSTADRLMKSPDSDLRSLAAHTLRIIGAKAKPKTPGLIQLLKDDNDSVCKAAALALAQIGPDAKKATPQLIELLKRRNPLLSVSVIWALEGIGPDANAAVDELLKALDDKNGSVREAAAGALAKVAPDKTTVPHLMELLDDKKGYVRIAAIDALGNIGTAAKPAVPRLLEMFSDNSPAIRQASVYAAIAIDPDPKHIPALIKMFNDSELEVRIAAAKAFAWIGPAAVPTLTEKIGQGPKPARIAAITALGCIGPEAESAVPALAKLLDDWDWRIQTAAADSLAEIGPNAKSVIPKLTALRDSTRDERVKEAALAAIEAIERLKSIAPGGKK